MGDIAQGFLAAGDCTRSLDLGPGRSSAIGTFTCWVGDEPDPLINIVQDVVKGGYAHQNVPMDWAIDKEFSG